MAIFNKINGKEANPLGPQKKFLLNFLNTEKCDIRGFDFNGFGYKHHNRCYSLTRGEVRKYNALKPKPKKEKIELSQEEKEKKQILAWSKRLATLADISIEQAIIIAKEKIEYKLDKIEMMEERQFDKYSVKRDKLINKMYRENPLRRIIDLEHAYAIIAASNRHNNSNYDDLLEDARELASLGQLNKSDVKEFARNNFHYHQ